VLMNRSIGANVVIQILVDLRCMARATLISSSTRYLRTRSKVIQLFSSVRLLLHISRQFSLRP
jgi:hypothetical protein